ncbi:hypothetical protein [Microlunatus flavus]|uniref:Uncharacterized protein n=1 Tax=Microlunatus flavus TaxID=1036181 RepID=A0A1H9CF20_9ACTN|nr:hypothetical protein [Microlunatus flavus]SEP99786.1 hypothetical protein SAMN05421756_102186 [Microlunatus flavus]
MPAHSLLRRLRVAATTLTLVVASAASATVPALADPAPIQGVSQPAAVATSSASSSSSKAHVPQGYDISWPSCPKGMGIPSRPTLGNPMPSKKSDFVVIGLTNGPGFYPNPCLQKHVDWAKKHHVWTAPYAFMTYPTAKLLKKYGTTGPTRARPRAAGCATPATPRPWSTSPA